VVDLLGEDRVMWASDYPHPDSTWPESQQAIADNFTGIPPRTARRILCENAKACTDSDVVRGGADPATILTCPRSARLRADAVTQ
jgi:hypothetical protein